MTHMAQQHTVVWRVEYAPKAFKLSKISVDSADQAKSRLCTMQTRRCYPLMLLSIAQQAVYVVSWQTVIERTQNSSIWRRDQSQQNDKALQHHDHVRVHCCIAGPETP